jgi:ribosomal protein L33
LCLRQSPRVAPSLLLPCLICTPTCTPSCCSFFYTTRKNPSTVQHKLGFRKYDPVVRQHVLFTEQKIKRGK